MAALAQQALLEVLAAAAGETVQHIVEVLGFLGKVLLEVLALKQEIIIVLAAAAVLVLSVLMAILRR
jgi:hypothetical protein